MKLAWTQKLKTNFFFHFFIIFSISLPLSDVNRSCVLFDDLSHLSHNFKKEGLACMIGNLEGLEVNIKYLFNHNILLSITEQEMLIVTKAILYNKLWGICYVMRDLRVQKYPSLTSHISKTTNILLSIIKQNMLRMLLSRIYKFLFFFY